MHASEFHATFRSASRRGRFLGGAVSIAILLTAGAARAGDEIATWDGSTGNWSDTAHWVFNPALVGTFPNNGNLGHTYDVRIDDGNAANSSVTLNVGVTIDSLSMGSGDTLSFNNSQDMRIANTGGLGLSNNGQINLNSTGSLTNLTLQSGLAITGSGEILMGDQNNNRILSNNSTITHGANHTIRGAGQVLGNVGGMSNAGAIIADQANNALVVDPSALGFTNTGTLQGKGAAGLVLQNGDFANAGGIIEALTASSVSINGATVTGGTLQGAGDFFLNGATLDALTNTSTLNQNNSADATALNTVTNNGTWNLGSTGSLTNLTLDGATLAGNGAVAMSDNSNNRIVASNTTATNGADHTIQGAGQLLANTGGMINDGTIIADRTNNALVIDPNALGFTNNGTLRGEGGAGMILQGGAFTNTSAIVEALTGSSVSINNASVAGGTLQGTGDFFLDGATLDTLTNTGTLNQNNGDDATATGTITNNGTWTVGSAGSNTDLTLDGATLGGNGSVAMGDNSNNRVLANNKTATNGADHTIQGAGQLLGNTGGMTNDGLVIADQTNNALVVDPSVLGFTNNGTLRASGDAGMVLQNGVFTNNSIVEALAASSVSINGATVTGGTLQGAGDFFLNGATLDALTNTGTLNQNNGAGATALNTVTNNGTWNLGSAGSNTDLTLDGATLAGNGSVAMGDNNNNRILASNTTATNGADHTIHGAGQLLAETGGMTNDGLIIADQANNALVIDPNALGFTNNGTLRASGDAGMVLQNGVFTNNSVVEALTNSSVSVNGSTVVGGTLQGAGDFFLKGATLDALTSTGTLNQNNGDDATATGTITNNGTWTLGSAGSNTDLTLDGATLGGNGSVAMGDNSNNRVLANNKTATNGADHTIQGAGQLLGNTGGMVNQGSVIADQTNNALVIDPSNLGFDNTGTVEAQGSAGLQITSGGTAFTTSTGTSNFRNRGQFTVTGGSEATVSGIYFQSAGTTQVDGTLNTPGVDLAGGTLKGAGTVNGPVVVGSASVNPGNSPGTLTIDGAYTMGPSGNLVIEIDSLASFDVLDVLGVATLDGSLDVITNSVFAHGSIAVGDTFDVLSATSISDGFDALTSSVVGLTFDKQVVAFGGGEILRLTVTGTPGPVPVPAALPLFGSALGAYALWRRRRRAH